MIVQVRFLVIQADTGGDGKPFDKEVIVGRLVESREAVGRRVEVSGEINLVQFVPWTVSFGAFGLFASMSSNAFCQNACQPVFLEDHRAVRVQAVIKP